MVNVVDVRLKRLSGAGVPGGRAGYNRSKAFGPARGLPYELPYGSELCIRSVQVHERVYTYTSARTCIRVHVQI